MYISINFSQKIRYFCTVNMSYQSKFLKKIRFLSCSLQVLLWRVQYVKVLILEKISLKVQAWVKKPLNFRLRNLWKVDKNARCQKTWCSVIKVKKCHTSYFSVFIFFVWFFATFSTALESDWIFVKCKIILGQWCAHRVYYARNILLGFNTYAHIST